MVIAPSYTGVAISASMVNGRPPCPSYDTVEPDHSAARLKKGRCVEPQTGALLGSRNQPLAVALPGPRLLPVPGQCVRYSAAPPDGVNWANPPVSVHSAYIPGCRAALDGDVNAPGVCSPRTGHRPVTTAPRMPWAQLSCVGRFYQTTTPTTSSGRILPKAPAYLYAEPALRSPHLPRSTPTASAGPGRTRRLSKAQSQCGLRDSLGHPGCSYYDV